MRSEETLWKLFMKLCGRLPIRLHCIIDGMDECDEDSVLWLVSKFRDLELIDANYAAVSVLVSGRSLTSLEGYFPTKIDLDNEIHVSIAVEFYVRAEVEALSQSLHLRHQFRDYVVRELLNKSGGTFLWVRLMLRELKKTKTSSQIESTLRQSPVPLQQLYDGMLQSIDADSRDHCIRLLRRAATASRPLSLEELANVFGRSSMDIVSRDQALLNLITACAPIIHVRNNQVDFIHPSAKDYLLRSQRDADATLETYRAKSRETRPHRNRPRRKFLHEKSWVEETRCQYSASVSRTRLKAKTTKTWLLLVRKVRLHMSSEYRRRSQPQRIGYKVTRIRRAAIERRPEELNPLGHTRMKIGRAYISYH